MKCSEKEKQRANALVIATKSSVTPKDYSFMASLLDSTSAKPYVRVDGRKVYLLHVDSMDGHIGWLEIVSNL